MSSAELGVHHASDIGFVYDRLNSSSETASPLLLSEMMLDYWVLFATGFKLEPNDGLGTSRPFSLQYMPENEEAIEFLRNNADAFHLSPINCFWAH
ncbi:hypothetical protein ARMGADRAFT_466032 [Armillaria gallica]|uniref:Carboxylesterase type B domain-containing protein n=1 Tax=Armillaria gallica TaxID=47427 RepID=A0A2H3CWE0_ARMGA|nr:hypothetical protein ARMGADRAFT_466032 [Armillaria gallica]